MPILDVHTDPARQTAFLRLLDEQENQLADHDVRLAGHSPALWEGLFDTRGYIDRYAGDDTDKAGKLLDELGGFLGRSVLGPAILAALGGGIGRKTLLVRLPPPGEDRLAAAFARVPWEIARGETGAPLRNVVVRVITAGMDAGSAAATVSVDDTLRVLLVFTLPPGASPLALRLERERLRAVCGHGNLNRLELVGEEGKSDPIRGEDLVEIFASAGGFIPQLAFLSACHSGAFIDARDWGELRRQAQGRAGTREADPGLERTLEEDRGYTGTALELLGAGIPQVVAMRYEVGDAYARRLGECFYRRLLAEGHAADGALALAREALKEDDPPHAPVDHANPLIFGGTSRPLSIPHGRSPQLDRWQPRTLLAENRDLDPPVGLSAATGN